MEISFENKRILVTGAGSGIGKAIVEKLIACKAKVLAVSKTKENLKSLKNTFGDSIDVLTVNLSDSKDIKLKLNNIGVIDGLVNNAAIAEIHNFLDAPEDSFDRQFNVNVKAVMHVSQIVAQNMIKYRVTGSIVNISSKASLAALQDHAIYCATKGALDALSRVMALELGGHNIRVNCVNPTVVLTGMANVGWSDPAKAKDMLDKIPLGRFCEVEDVVGPVLFLLSDHSRMINGVSLPIDGGFLCC